jgi:hypothetical protein
MPRPRQRLIALVSLAAFLAGNFPSANTPTAG